MTSKLLRIVPMVLAISVPSVALAADPPAGDAKHEAGAKKKKGDEKKDEKKADEKKDEKK